MEPYGVFSHSTIYHIVTHVSHASWGVSPHKFIFFPTKFRHSESLGRWIIWQRRHSSACLEFVKGFDLVFAHSVPTSTVFPPTDQGGWAIAPDGPGPPYPQPEPVGHGRLPLPGGGTRLHPAAAPPPSAGHPRTKAGRHPTGVVPSRGRRGPLGQAPAVVPWLPLPPWPPRPPQRRGVLRPRLEEGPQAQERQTGGGRGRSGQASRVERRSAPSSQVGPSTGQSVAAGRVASSGRAGTRPERPEDSPEPDSAQRPDGEKQHQDARWSQSGCGQCGGRSQGWQPARCQVEAAAGEQEGTQPENPRAAETPAERLRVGSQGSEKEKLEKEEERKKHRDVENKNKNNIQTDLHKAQPHASATHTLTFAPVYTSPGMVYDSVTSPMQTKPEQH